MRRNVTKTRLACAGLLCSAVVVTALSWWKYHLTGSLLVDENELHGGNATAFIVTYLGALFLAGASLYRITFAEHSVSPRGVLLLSIGVYAISALSLPFLSNDVFGYLAYGDLAARGVSSYVDGGVLRESRFFEAVSPMWRDTPNTYGPSLIVWFMLSNRIATTLAGTLAALKAVNFLFASAYALLVYEAASTETNRPSSPNWQALLSLSPLVWIQGLGQVHNDAIVMVYACIFVFACRRANVALAAVAVAAIALSKFMYAFVFVPLLIFYVLHARGFRLREILSPLAVSLLVLTAVFAVGYAPVWEGTETLLNGLLYYRDVRPGNSNVEVAAELAHFTHALATGGVDGLVDAATHYVQADPAKDGYLSVFTVVFKCLGVVVAAWVGLGALFASDGHRLMHAFGAILTAAVCFYAPVFHPWYLLLALPFFMSVESPPWASYLVVVLTLVNAHEVFLVADGGEAIAVGVVPTMIVTVLSFYWRFGPRFIAPTAAALRQRQAQIREAGAP